MMKKCGIFSLVMLMLYVLLSVSGNACAQSITITAPTTNDVLRIGHEFTITWNNPEGFTGNVNISYEHHAGCGGAESISIADNIVNTGSYTWLVPDVDVPIQITVSSVDVPGIYGVTSEFIMLVHPSLAFVYPVGGEQMPSGKKVPIQWESTGIPGNVKIEYEYSTGCGTTGWVTIEDNASMTRFYEWTVPAEEITNVIFRITPLDAEYQDVVAQTSGGTSFVFPSITVTNPAEAAELTIGQTVNIEWTTTALYGPYKIEMVRSNGCGVTGTETISVWTNNPGSYEWIVTDPANDYNAIKITSMEFYYWFGAEEYADITGVSGTFAIVAAQ